MNKPFVFTAIISILLFAYLTLNSAANWLEAQPAEQKFQVVDAYEGCDVVQYSPTYASRYYYFLHCKK
jgi:hypothetical protein